MQYFKSKNEKYYKLYISLASIFFTGILIAVLIAYYNNGLDLALSILIIGLALSIYLYFFSMDVFHPIGVYTLFWLGTAGLACFKISNDQKDWGWYMWIVVLTAYISFTLGYFIYYLINKRKTNLFKSSNKNIVNVKRLYISIIFLVIIAGGCFLLEVLVLRFIPIFSSNMSAYKDFHLPGIHYFVVSVGIIPMLTIYYKAIGGKKNILWINVVCFIIPILIVSRQLTILQVITLLLAYNYYIKRIKINKLISFALVAIVIFTASFKLRNQSVQYFKQAANITIESESILLQPYVYFASNFENLRSVVDNFHDYRYGQNMVFPILALTNTDQIFDYSYKKQYLTNKNLTTFTYLADIYFDFGYVGVIMIPLILGLVYFKYYMGMKLKKNLFDNNIYILLLYCLIFCFFVNWYYNATMIFYLILLLIIKRYTKVST